MWVLARFLFVTLAMVGLAVPSHAQETSTPAVLVEPNPIVVDDTGTASAKVINSTAVELKVTVRVVDGDGAEVDAAAPSGSQTLDPAGELPLTFDVPDGDDLRVVVVVEPVDAVLPAGAVVRASVSRDEEGSAEPIVASWQATYAAGSRNPWGNTTTVPLDGSCSGLHLDANAMVGAVETDGRAIRVRANCGTAGPTSVKLDFGAVGWDGATYSGTIDLTPEDEETGAVSLKLVSTTAWYWVGLMLLVGIGVGASIERWRKHGREANWWRAELSDIRGLVDGPNPIDQQFHDRASMAALPDALQHWTIKAGVDEEIKAHEGEIKATRFGREPTLAIIGEKIMALRKTVSSWPAVVTTLRDFMINLPRLTRTPRVEQAIRKRVFEPETTEDGDKKTLALATVRQVAEDAAAGAAFASSWPAEALERIAVRRRELAAGGVPEEELTKTDALFEQLANEANQAAALARATDLEDVYEELEAADARLLDATVEDHAAAPLAGVLPRTVVDPRPVPRSKPSPATEADELRLRMTIVDWVLFCVAALAALIAGMTALAVGKTFGGVGDMLVALSWGIVGGTAAGPVADALVKAQEAATRLRR